MDPRDFQNLSFLLTASTKTIEDWFEQTSEDDHVYALELLREARIELQLNAQEQSKEGFAEAKQILSKF